MRNTTTSYKNVIKLGIYSFILLNIFTNAIKILPSGAYYRELLVIELLITIIVAMDFGFKIPIESSAKQKIVAIFLSQFLAYFFTTLFEKYDCFDIHRLIAFLLMYIVLFEAAKFGKITKRDFEQILKIIIIIGIVACFYNIFIHRDTILTLNLTKIMYYTSTYSAFFLTRSNFCLLLVVCYVISLYFYDLNKKRIFILLAVFFVGNVLLTNARTSIIILALITANYLFMKKNGSARNIIIIILCGAILALLPWDSIILNFKNIMDKYSLIFRINSSDFSNGRLELWWYAFKDMDLKSFLLGHGIGSKDAYLGMIGAIAYSFHSSWIDLFYEGGMCLFLIYASVFIYVIKYVKNSTLSVIQKKMFYNFIIILLVSGIGDAIALPFMLDTSTIFSTLVFITFPICTVNGDRRTAMRGDINES